jgi:hypothetical protein
MKEQMIFNRQQLDSFYQYLASEVDSGPIKISVASGKQRTLTQNRALHLYCKMLSQALNDAGYDFRLFIKEGVEVPFTPELVKEYLWKPVQKAVLDIDSTTEANKEDYGKVYDALNMHLINTRQIFVEWPDKYGSQNITGR